MVNGVDYWDTETQVESYLVYQQHDDWLNFNRDVMDLFCHGWNDRELFWHYRYKQNNGQHLRMEVGENNFKGPSQVAPEPMEPVS